QTLLLAALRLATAGVGRAALAGDPSAPARERRDTRAAVELTAAAVARRSARDVQLLASRRIAGWLERPGTRGQVEEHVLEDFLLSREGLRALAREREPLGARVSASDLRNVEVAED